MTARRHTHHFFLSLQGDTVFAGVCLFVCLSTTLHKSYERISMKFSGSVGSGTRTNRLDFGSYQ